MRRQYTGLFILICLMLAALPTVTSAAGLTSSARANPASTPPGTSVSIEAAVTSDSALGLLVDMEVYRSDGQRVFQQWWDNQGFTAGQSQVMRATWAVPSDAAPGTYVIKIGLFSPGWGTLYSWNDSAGQVTVTGGAPDGAAGSGLSASSYDNSGGAQIKLAWSSPSQIKQIIPMVRLYLPTVSNATPTQPPTTPTPGTGQYFKTLPPGSSLPSDAACAAAVKRRAETKGMNATANATRGNQQLDSNFTHFGPRVTGNFTGTTDEILQWAACKWGVDEDMVRAQAAIESWWHQDTLGDWTDDASRCAPGRGLGVDGRAGQCPESFGILQNRYPYEQVAWPGIANSTAFNADVAYAIWRGCYEGYETWLNDVEHGQPYAAGDEWGCFGRWFAGRWHTQAAEDYIVRVRDYLNSRVWEQASFQEP